MADKAIETLEYTLPIGFQEKDTEFKTFALGSVRGRLRREFFNLKKRGPGRELLCALKHVLTELGASPKPVDSFIKKLPVPDIDYIFLLVCAQEGDGKISWDFVCKDSDGGGCQSEMALSIDPRDIELLPANPPIQFDNLGRPTQTVDFMDPVSQSSFPITYKVPTLGDQIKMFDRMTAKDNNLGNFLFHQIEAMMLDYNGKGRGLTVTELDDLPVRTLDALLEINTKYNPTQIDSDLEIRCSNCGMVHEAVLPVDNWLVPFVGRRRSVT
jgi:hypothetical protein